MSNELIPNDDSKMIPYSNSASIANLLYSLPALEYEIILLASKGLNSRRITKYLVDIIEDDDNVEEYYFLGKNISDGIDECDLKSGVEEYLSSPEIVVFIEFIQTQSNNKVFRKAQLEHVLFDAYLEMIKKNKRGELGDMTQTQLINFTEKVIKQLHLEEDRNKSDVKDGIKLIKEYYAVMNINPIISSEEGYDFYDEDFFGPKTANNASFVRPDDAIEIDHSDKND